MCNFFEDKFEKINRLKYLMTLSGNNMNRNIYKEKIEDVFKEFEGFKKRFEEELLILTPEELASFNGENGKPAYVVIDNVIYDITNIDLFKKKPHDELKLGRDLTKEFNECYEGDLTLLDNIPIVGLLAEPEEIELIESAEEYYPQKRFKIISSEELKKYNGENGNPSYIAVDGIVYDVTGLSFLKSIPNDKLHLGADVTKEFNEYRKENKDLLKGATKVAVLHDFEESQRGKHIEEVRKDLTLTELRNYDGKNGNPAYIAVDGIIYDVSNVEVFKNDSNNKLRSGSDLTSVFNECYNEDKSILVGLPIVGKIIYNNINYSRRYNVNEFNVNELRNYNGQNGRPPYIAILGTVYDLTDVEKWKEKNIKVGCDLTGEYREVYGNDKTPLKNLKVVGVLSCSCKDC